MYRVASAQARRLRALAAIEPIELLEGATGALALTAHQRRDLHPLVRVLPQIQHHQFAVDRFLLTRKDFQCLGRLHIRDYTDRWPEHARRFAGTDFARSGTGFKHATQARRVAGDDRHRHAFGADRTAVHPRFAELHGDIVDGVTHLEVIGAIEDEIGILAEFLDVRAIDIGNDRFEFHTRVNLPHLDYGGFRFRHVVRHIGFVEQHLPLEVARFDEVAVDDADMPDTRAHEIVGEYRTERADSAERHAAIHDAFLTRFADTRDAHLTGISFESVVHNRRGIATLLRFR